MDSPGATAGRIVANGSAADGNDANGASAHCQSSNRPATQSHEQRNRHSSERKNPECHPTNRKYPNRAAPKGQAANRHVSYGNDSFGDALAPGRRVDARRDMDKRPAKHRRFRAVFVTEAAQNVRRQLADDAFTSVFTSLTC